MTPSQAVAANRWVLETALHEGARGVATFGARLAACCRAAGLDVLGGDEQ